MINNHHIDPRSRFKGKNILGVCKVDVKQHELYHQLFGNMCPEEVVEFLNETFWRNLFEIEITLINKRKWRNYEKNKRRT